MVSVKSFMVPREQFITVERDTDAQTAARIMRDCDIGSLFVTNEKEIVGILTDTDMVRRVVATDVDTAKTTVEQIMSAPIITIEEGRPSWMPTILWRKSTSVILASRETANWSA